MDKDDVFSIFSDDDEDFDICFDGSTLEDLSDDAKIGEAIFELYKKHKINNLKRRIGSSVLSEICNFKRKKDSNVKSNFSRLSCKCFSELVNSLSSDQIAVIQRFGFGHVLNFADCSVPKSFVKWISSIVDVRTSEFVFKEKAIPFSKQSVHNILGLPIGGEVLVRDYEAGKSFLLSKFGIDHVQSMDFFAEKLTGAHDMSDEEVFICFMIVALGCFVCPNSSYEPMIQLVHVFLRPHEVQKYDWSQCVFELFMEYVIKLQKQSWKIKNDSLVMCASAYVLAVLYLDCLNFGTYDVSPTIPRTLFWKGSVVKHCSELDELKPGKYGRRPFKVDIDTSYSQHVHASLGNSFEHSSAECEFKAKLEQFYGSVRPEEIYGSHCAEQAKVNERSCQELLFKIFSFCNDLSDKLRQENCVSEEEVANEDLVLDSGAGNVNICAQNLLGNIRDDTSAKSEPEGHFAGGSFDLSLKVGHDVGTSVVNVVNHDGPKSGVQLVNGVPCCNVELPERVDNKIEDKASDVFVDGILAGLPKPVFDLSTPGFINARNVLCSGPSVMIAESPHLKHKKISKGLSIDKKSFGLDLNKCQPSSSIGCLDLHTPKDLVIDVDNVELIPDLIGQSSQKVAPKVAESKLPAGNRQSDNIDNSTMSTKKYASRSGAILSKLQIGDLNAPVVESIQKSKTPDVSLINIPDDVEEKNNVEVIDDVDNDVKIVGEVTFQSKTKALCNKSELLYNKSIAAGPSCINVNCARPSVPNPGAGITGFPVTDKERRNYLAACRLASSTRWKEEYCVDIGKCSVKFKELGNSLRSGCKVGSFVINALCRKFFLDERPTISRKHYFFSSVGAILLQGDGNISYVKKCFDGAASVLPLHLADMLLFPICHDEHWFVFVVDIRNTLFVFLDSYYSEDDDYHVYVRSNLIPSFKKLWKELVNGPIDFEQFDVTYPPVPKQNNLTDCGFSQDDIDHIRIQTVSNLVCSEHNIANSSPIINYFGEGPFPRVGQIRKSTVQY
ncbi:hypothetical protein ACP70R_041162 [Stipagrostis hirtigluma subsp. patula]